MCFCLHDCMPYTSVSEGPKEGTVYPEVELQMVLSYREENEN